MLVLLALVAVAAGAVVIWPFVMYPKTVLEIERIDPQPSQPQDSLLAGVAERDITPPVGIPKMGYSAWARNADGFRNRLKARAFYLKGPDTLPLMVIQADLPASSLVLQREVARRVAAHTDIPAQSLSIHVTHTHSGPGQFMDSDFYNTFGSNTPGFDPQLFEFLARRISEAVIEAYRTRRAARVAVGSIEIYGATKNRSMGAYVRNENVTDKREDAAAALRAINPLITLVRIDGQTPEGDFKPLGAFSTFAVHGTGIPPFTHPYHGDVWAFFERELEWQIERHYHTPWKPVHGPFEANHADNNPNYRHGLRGDIETRRIGLALAERAWQLFRQLDDQMTADIPLNAAMREIDLLQERPGDALALCERAIAGTAVVGAAKGDEVFPISYLPPFQAGWPDDGEDDCHGAKRWMMGALQAWGLAPHRYPHRVNISAIQVGGLVLVGLPFEITFEAGNRIARAVNDVYQQQGLAMNHTVISSHTNGFFGYSTTPEEYGAQWYEGGHTIYGPNTTPFLARESARLVQAMLEQPGYADLPGHSVFTLASRDYFPPQLEIKGKRVELQAPLFVDASANRESYWEWRVLDVAPGQLQLHEPLLMVEASDDGITYGPLRDEQGVPVNDQGYDLQIIYDGDSDAGMARYRVRWYNPVVARQGQWFRFSMERRAGLDVVTSSAFR